MKSATTISLNVAGKAVLVVLLLAALLAVTACSSDDTAPAAQVPLPVAPSATPTITASPLAATATALPAPLDTPSAAEAATDTPAPAATPAATPTTAPTTAPNLSAINLSLELLASGLDQPVFATHAGDGSGRIFVLEKNGTIAVLTANGAPAGLFLDIRDRVGSDASEQGLLGLALHPSFGANGRLFTYYTDRRGDTVISSFQADEDRATADPESEIVLLTQEQPADNHNGGMIAFGPDGYLYAGLGDGGGAGDRYDNGQNLATILGTIIRLDVDGDQAFVPADNPFVDRDRARPEIWAYGLRNPWRFSFDRATGDLWIGDVGQNQWEEINFQPAGSAGGENYGWSITEASHCYDADTCDRTGLTSSVAEYDHDNGCSVTGGYVYRGQQPALQGIYFYGDYCSGRIWGTARDAGGGWQSKELIQSDVQISSFGETEDGELLLMDLGGAIYRLVSAG